MVHIVHKIPWHDTTQISSHRSTLLLVFSAPLLRDKVVIGTPRNGPLAEHVYNGQTLGRPSHLPRWQTLGTMPSPLAKLIAHGIRPMWKIASTVFTAALIEGIEKKLWCAISYKIHRWGFDRTNIMLLEMKYTYIIELLLQYAYTIVVTVCVQCSAPFTIAVTKRTYYIAVTLHYTV